MNNNGSFIVRRSSVTARCKRRAFFYEYLTVYLTNKWVKNLVVTKMLPTFVW